MAWLYEILVPHWMFLVLGPIYIGLEIFNPLVKKQKLFRKEWGEDVFWYVLNNVYIDSWLYYVRTYISLSLGPLIWRFIITTLFSGNDYVAGRLPLKIENGFLLGVILFFSIDFFAYWIHYLFHRVKFLWSFHILHHSTRELDWLSGHRAYWLDGVIFNFFATIPLALFEVSNEGLTLIALWETNLQFFTHTNSKYPIGFLRKWLNNNQVHWWHHSRVNHCKYGQNFGTYTSIWDHLFGTYYVEEEVPRELGLNDPTSYPHGVIKRFFYPLTRLLAILKRGS